MLTKAQEPTGGRSERRDLRTLAWTFWGLTLAGTLLLALTVWLARQFDRSLNDSEEAGLAVGLLIALIYAATFAAGGLVLATTALALRAGSGSSWSGAAVGAGFLGCIAVALSPFLGALLMWSAASWLAWSAISVLAWLTVMIWSPIALFRARGR